MKPMTADEFVEIFSDGPKLPDMAYYRIKIALTELDDIRRVIETREKERLEHGI